MAKRTGSADLPLHGGQVPPWLAGRMARLGRVIVEAIAHHYGRDEVLRRLAHPFWFQSFGAVMGMDWHSSGITTSVVGALKRGLEPVKHELGLYVCGGRGRHSRKTPDELVRVAELVGGDGQSLVRSSRLVAKVDSAAVQDGFELYLHSFIVAADGAWTVVQQGMNAESRSARRYHWLSTEIESFVDEPHTAIEGENRGVIVNLTDHRAESARRAQLELIAGPHDRVLATLRTVRDAPQPEPVQESLPHLSLPARHHVDGSDVLLRRLHGALAAAAEAGPRDFAELLLIPGVGARTVESLALVGEVIFGAPYRFSDPARFAFAHGGKDGHPFPVPLRVYDETIRVLHAAVDRAKIGNDDKLNAIKTLDRQARWLESRATGPSFDELVARERRASARYAGRTAFNGARTQRRKAERTGQLRLRF
jgi:uncharacterized protein